VDILLEAAGINKEFAGNNAVLKNVSLKIRSGSIVALIGDSGGGKTTLCRVFTGLEKASSGKVLFKGKEMSCLRGRSFEDCASIQYIFQDPYAALEEESTVCGVLLEPVSLCRKRGRDYMSPEEALDWAGLPAAAFLSRKIKTLSGGQRQRVGIARALIPRPDLIIADECTSMLDGQSTTEIGRIFKKLNKKLGLSFIIVTHNMHFLYQVVDYIYVLHEGLIVEAGPKDRILNIPCANYTREYMESMREIEGGCLLEQDCLCQSQ
jgi:ABC-type glutathione transport system ATPase component